jgi:hypothetical protein
VTNSHREGIIRKLLALRELMQRGGTEAESLNAAEKYATMAAKYNIELHELDDGDEVIVEELQEPGKYNETWRKRCYGAAAEMYLCHYFWRSVKGKRDFSVKHCIVGEPHNVAVALEMGKFFEDTINRLGNDAARANKHVTDRSHTDRHRFIRSFRISAADRLKLRVKDYVRRAKEGGLRAEDGSQLPALVSLFDNSLEQYEAWKKANKIEIDSVSSRDQYLSDLGSALGNEAGKTISLSTQIKHGASSKYALT